MSSLMVSIKEKVGECSINFELDVEFDVVYITEKVGKLVQTEVTTLNSGKIPAGILQYFQKYIKE